MALDTSSLHHYADTPPRTYTVYTPAHTSTPSPAPSATSSPAPSPTPYPNLRPQLDLNPSVPYGQCVCGALKGNKPTFPICDTPRHPLFYYASADAFLRPKRHTQTRRFAAAPTARRRSPRATTPRCRFSSIFVFNRETLLILHPTSFVYLSTLYCRFLCKCRDSNSIFRVHLFLGAQEDGPARHL